MGWRSEGKFKIAADVGPSPGRYRVEVHRVAADFSEPQTGNYSIEDAQLFTKSSPGGEDLVVDISREMGELEVKVSTK
jgi:hypothetical protein